MGKIQKIMMAEGTAVYAYGGKMYSGKQMKQICNQGGGIFTDPDDRMIIDELNDLSLNDGEQKERPNDFAMGMNGNMSRGGSTLADIRSKPGGSNVGKDRKTSSAGEGPFVGPKGGAPAGSFPVTNERQARAALSYSRNAPNPSGIKNAVYKIAHSKDWFQNGGLKEANNKGNTGVDDPTVKKREPYLPADYKKKKHKYDTAKPPAPGMVKQGVVNGKIQWGYPEGDFSEFNKQPTTSNSEQTKNTTKTPSLQESMKPYPIMGNYGDIIGVDKNISDDASGITYGEGISIDANGNVVYKSKEYLKALQSPGFVDASGKYIDQQWKAPVKTQTQQQTTGTQQVKESPSIQTNETGSTEARDKIKSYQSYLNSLGANLSVDGIWGPKTQAAYDQFVKNKQSVQQKQSYQEPEGPITFTTPQTGGKPMTFNSTQEYYDFISRKGKSQRQTPSENAALYQAILRSQNKTKAPVKKSPYSHLNKKLQPST
jgi:hypothetical protein